MSLSQNLARYERPDTSMTVHQAAKFSTYLKAFHDTVVNRFSKCLLGANNEGLMRTNNKDKGLEVLVHAYFDGGFNATTAEDPVYGHSRKGFVIKCTRCLTIWKSKLQTEIALSTSEVEHTTLLTTSRETTPIMHLLKEISAVTHMPTCVETIKCTVFEDNDGAVELVKARKIIPRTKHIDIKYHHFRSCI